MAKNITATRRVGGTTKVASGAADIAKLTDEDAPKGRKAYNFRKAQIRVPVLDGAGKATEETELVPAVNGDGALVGVPVRLVDEESGEVVQAGFDPNKHKPLTKADFASEDVFLDYRAFVAQCRATMFGLRAKDLAARANKLRKFGDDKTRKAAQRRDRMREALKKLEAQLMEDGVDLDELDGEVDAPEGDAV